MSILNLFLPCFVFKFLVPVSVMLMVHMCVVCEHMCVCRHKLPMFGVEIKGGHQVSSSITLHFIPLRKNLSLDLELDWQPASPCDPLVSDPHSTGVTHEYGEPGGGGAHL